MCCRLKTGKRKEGEVFGSIPSLSHLTSQTQKDFSTALIWESEAFFFFLSICSFIKQPNLPCLGWESTGTPHLSFCSKSQLLEIEEHNRLGWGCRWKRLRFICLVVCFPIYCLQESHCAFSTGNWFCLHSFSSNCSWKLWIMAVLPISDDTFLPVTS